MLEWGADYEFLLDQERLRGIRVDALDRMPWLEQDLARVLEAFKVVGQHRPQSMNGEMLPVPLTEIRAGWETCGIKDMGLPLSEFTSYMIALDETLIEHYKKRRPAKNTGR